MPRKKKPPKGELIGRTIKSIRPASQMEKRAAMWYEDYLIITFDDGTEMFAMGDDEGNRPGVLIHVVDGKQFYVRPR